MATDTQTATLTEEQIRENEQQVLAWCSELACSTGLYGRLLNDLRENPDYLRYFAEQDFKDSLDFVLFYEC